VRALVAYLEWLSEGINKEDLHAWRGSHLADHQLVPLDKLDPRRGETLFTERCSTCHGRDGQGIDLGELKPAPLWGDKSWNDGAGVSRTYTLAAFLHGAMPYTAPGSLSVEDAQQIAAYLTSKPRPVFTAKDRDYLAGEVPPDAVYYRHMKSEKH
jgi:thiosulfate dehydrogenase